MAYEISVGPAQLTINIGECVLIAEQDGQIHQPSERGLFYRDTRLISAWTILGDGVPWRLLSSAATDHFASQVVMINRTLPKDGGEIAAGSLSLTLSRMLGLGGMRETLEVRNHNRTPVRLALTVSLSCDFADIFDVKSNRLVSRGATESTWSPDEGRFETIHVNDRFRRGLSIVAADGAPRPVLVDGALRFSMEVQPQGTWSTDLLYQVIDGDERLEASPAAFHDRDACGQVEALRKWREQALRIRVADTDLQQIFEQSVDDLAALRLPIAGTDNQIFIPAAGIPWFAALFGRDSLITAIQTVPVYPDFARGALSILARYQADGVDDARDMQPGKIPHELRHGELAQLGLVPYTPYYGTADATPLYIILLHHAWFFTGDRSLIEQHLETAERCLAWIDDYGDLDGDGFQEYRRRSPSGAENQGWKDSGNAILDEKGDDVPAPKALCELQGYVYDAWRRMALMYDALDRPDRAEAMRAKASDLFERFNATFWDEDAQFYALCLDPDKRRVMSVASNPGHLLWSGIVPRHRAAAVVRRLLADDMWSGWGIRTFSADHPAYNPNDYQLGAIWPHDNGIIAVGFAQYGFRDEAARVARGLIDAGSRFMLHRLPEVFAGTSRAISPFPVQYLGANVPQAWASGSIFNMIRSMIGIAVDPPNKAVYADPHLPDWLPELRVEKLGFGDATIDVLIRRVGNSSRVEIVRGGEGLTVVERPLGEAMGLSLVD